jgi:hypothetical protein
MTRPCVVLWRDGTGLIYAGEIEFGAHDLTFEGSCHGRHRVLKTIPYGDLAGAHLTREREESVYGKLTLVLELREGGAVQVSSANGDSTVRDLQAQIKTLLPRIPIN